MKIELLDKEYLPDGFEYPVSLLKIIDLGLTNIDPWFIQSKELAILRINGLRVRYPSRILVPFAQRRDRDDVACFDLNEPGKIQIIHDFASPGWEQRKVYEDFWDWFKDAIEEMIRF